LALASRGLTPTRIVHDSETVEPRTSVFETVQVWFVAIMASVFAVAGIGSSLPIG
jgi:hypothetical protein